MTGDRRLCKTGAMIGPWLSWAVSAKYTSKRLVLVGLVLCSCALLTGASPSWASALGRRARVSASFVAVGSEVSAAGTVRTATLHGGPRSHWRVVLQQRVGSRWLTRATGHLRAHSDLSGFSLAWTGSVLGRRETVRVAVISGRRVIGESAPRSVMSTSPVSVQSTLRASTAKPSSAQILSVNGNPDGTTVVQLAKGARVPAVGSALVIDPSSKAPNGLLGVVTSVSSSSGATTVMTRPGTLEDAYSSFDAHLSGKLGELAEEATTASFASRRAHSAVNLGIFKASFSCDDPSAQHTITHNIDLSEVEVHAEVTIPSPSTGFSGPGVLFTLGGHPKFELGVQFTGETKCVAKAMAKIPIPDTPGLVVEIGPDFTLTASGAVGVELDWTPWFFYGFSRFRGEPSNDWKSFKNEGHTNFTGDASLTLGLALEAGLSLDGRVGIRGSLGPEVTGKVATQTSPAQTCLSVNADFAANLSAFANVFFTSYTFDIGSAKFGDLQLYHNCTGASPPPVASTAPVSTAPTSSSSPEPTVPATGPTLVYAGQSALPPEADSVEFTGDHSFEAWSAATGESAEVDETLPSTITPYRCVVLLTNESLGEIAEAELSAYLRQGGTIVALGEHEGGDYDLANETLSRFASFVGVGMSLVGGNHDYGQNTTYAIDPSPLTEGVFTLGDNWASTVEVSGAAEPLAGTADGEGTLVGAQKVANGTFVMAGDSNLFTDEDQGVYEDDDNGQFASDLCP